MTTLEIPKADRTPWPTLGPGVCDFIEDYLPHGPGDLKGQKATLDDETRALIYRTYEVYPKDHAFAGRRRFKRVAWSLRKGTAKTEKAAWLAACELHPDAPVRCSGWRRVGKRYEPVGRGVRDPYIPLVAYTEEQTEELAYGALYVILSESPLADDFDIGLDRIVVLDDRGRANGKAVALASAPDSTDGARTTFQHFDETHRLKLQRQRQAHQTMLENIPKRKLADPWSFETTTAFVPGEGSVAESTWGYADKVRKGQVTDPRLFFFHRQAGDRHDLTTEEGARAAVVEASGPLVAWTDIESVMERWSDPTTDLAYWERVWTNRPKQSASQAYDVARWKDLGDDGIIVPPGTAIGIGVSGGRFEEALAIVATTIEGHQWPLGIWERPANAPDTYEHPVDKINGVMEDAFESWEVWRAYVSYGVDHLLDRWRGTWGERRVLPWNINRYRQMAHAVKNHVDAVNAGDLTHNGAADLTRHIGAARRREVNEIDEDDPNRRPLWVLDRNGVEWINGANAAVISWECRGDAIVSGEVEREPWFAFG